MALADPEQPTVPQTRGYVSPYGKPRGLRARLAKFRTMLSQQGLPWHGTGIIDDMELLMQILNKREWLEKLRTSDDPDAQRFAAELLDDDETNEAVQSAADQVRTQIPDVNTESTAHRAPTYDPVATIEHLDEAAVSAQAAVAAMRRTLERAGVVDDETPDEMLPDLLQALLA